MMSADAFDHTPAHSVEIVNNVNFADLIVALFILLLIFFVIITDFRGSTLAYAATRVCRCLLRQYIELAMLFNTACLSALYVVSLIGRFGRELKLTRFHEHASN